ncbi:hypothetical protein [Halorubrum sp. 48-1-W]|uniref:hypothetical protein n=1 Tax=Halorubrum sp. 48-1-W TaxID=2249761 RepID=UPI0018E54DE9|nr:hypothetical protein [Halorubrum sp. 48-1-W]
MLSSRDISEAYMWLSSDAARYVTGITLPAAADEHDIPREGDTCTNGSIPRHASLAHCLSQNDDPAVQLGHVGRSNQKAFEHVPSFITVG